MAQSLAGWVMAERRDRRKLRKSVEKAEAKPLVVASAVETIKAVPAALAVRATWAVAPVKAMLAALAV